MLGIIPDANQAPEALTEVTPETKTDRPLARKTPDCTVTPNPDSSGCVVSGARLDIYYVCWIPIIVTLCPDVPAV